MTFRKTIIVITLACISSLCLNSTIQGWETAGYPRLANYYLASELTDRDTGILARWDLLVLYNKLDINPDIRERLKKIKELNPDMIFLIYTSSIETNVTEVPPGPMAAACDQYDWWLRDAQGSKLPNPDFPWSVLINMTNTERASGSHPTGKKPNEFLAEMMIEDHVLQYDYWDGIFFDTFADNLGWMYRDVKDANRNGIAEYDDEVNNNEPRFSDLWTDASLTLLNNTIALAPDVIVIGNGLHKAALDNLNGRLLENFVKSSNKNMHLLSSNHKYLKDGIRPPRISIVNGWLKDQDPTQYRDMRFSLCATLMTDNYYSCDFGSQYHGETLWFDEFSVRQDGTVDARTTTLTSGIDPEQSEIAVASTAGFAENGIVEISGEQVHYGSKSGTQFLECYRGYPNRNKYNLSASHPAGSVVIQHLTTHRGYLGNPLGPSYDVTNTAIKLDDLLEQAGWFPGEDDIREINSRVWRRDFMNGAAVVNPTEGSSLVGGLGSHVYRRITGIQDPSHNNGLAVNDTLRVASGDGYILLWISEPDSIPPLSPEGFRFKPQTAP